MPIIIVVFLSMFFMMSAATLETSQDAARQDHLAESRHTRTIALAQLVNRYLDERGGTAPVSLTALAATPGFQEANQFQLSAGPHGDGPFLAVFPMTNGTNTYSRIIVYMPPYDGSISAADYLLAANNACGTTAASQAGAWCGDPKGSYWITDTIDRIAIELSRERTQQQQTLKKFAQIYSTNQIYPNPGTGNASALTLISLLPGYSATAATCTGVWKAQIGVAGCTTKGAKGPLTCTEQWQAIPLTCEDLYTIWGTPRVYNFLEKDRIALYAEAPWKDIGGLPNIVASQLDSREPPPP